MPKPNHSIWEIIEYDIISWKGITFRNKETYRFNETIS